MDSVAPLAFPYTASDPKKAPLVKLVLHNEEDTSNIALSIDDGICRSIERKDTTSSHTTPPPLRYVSSVYLSLPLLLCVPHSHRQVKHHIDVAQLEPALHKERELVIVKSPAPEDMQHLAELLRLETCSEPRNVAKISYVDFIPAENLKIAVVKDTLPTCTASQTYTVSLWEKNGQDHLLLFQFDIWLEQKSPLEFTVNLPRVDQTADFGTSDLNVEELRKAFNMDLSDGPEFRRALNKYEHDTPRIKLSLSALQEQVKGFENVMLLLQERKNNIIDRLGILLEAQFNPLLLKLQVHAAFTAKFSLVFNAFQSNCSFIFDEILNQSLIAKIIAYSSITLTENGYEPSATKREFEKLSKEYYDWLNKYLSNEKDRPKLKLLRKRKNFELLKFDYLNSLNFASNNQYFNQFLENIMKFTNLPVNNGFLDYKVFTNNKKSQQLLNGECRLYLDILSCFNSEKLQLRQMIEACQTNEELTSTLKENLISFPGKKNCSDGGRPKNETAIDPDAVFPASSAAAAPKAVLNVAHDDTDHNPSFAGILYALGGQGKPGWHKEWVVVRNGQLMEFSDWRYGTSSINKPIDLAIASVKPVNHDKRNNCFEIISSSGHKRVFQALNSEERCNWMRALYNAGQVTNRLMQRPKTQQLDTNLEKPISRGPSGEQGSPVSIFSSAFTAEDEDVLAAVRAIKESGNDICADCESPNSVEWISLNKLVAICVQCSSCHRNMGLHISKVKSLKLDNFKDEQRVLLNYINNNLVNQYLEATALLKIGPDASDEERLCYIRQKYEKKAFVGEKNDFKTALVQLIRLLDVQGVIKSLNCGADPNICVQISHSAWPEPKTVSLFGYSLKKVVEVDIKGNTKGYFVVSELLFLNNCRVTEQVCSDIGVSEQALLFWRNKAALHSNGDGK